MLILWIVVSMFRAGWHMPTKNGPEQPLLGLVDLCAGLAGGWLLLRRNEAMFKTTPLAGLGAFMLVIFCFGTIVHPIYESARSVSSQAICLSGIKQLEVASVMYSADFDDRCPPAKNWRTLIQPYRPDSPSPRCPSATSPYTYAMSSALSLKDGDKLRSPAADVQLFETDSQVFDAEGGPESFVPRHGGRGSIAFVDGHAGLLGLKRDFWTPK